MKRRSMRLLTMIVMFFGAVLSTAFAGSSFELTQDGMRYVTRDAGGNIVKSVTPSYDMPSGQYVVKDASQQIVAKQALPTEAAMSQIKIVAPVSSDNTQETKAKDFLGNSVPVLRDLPTSDPRYAQLKGYIDSDPGIKNVVAMQLEARDVKINQLQQQLSQGSRDPALAQWLVSDLKKPIYLEVGESGTIYHDSNGFVLAERGTDGQVAYRDNAYANRLVVPGNSEAFTGDMKDPAASSVISHELGHMIMDQTYETPNYPKTTYVGPHSKDAVTDEGFAISEGWAEAVETQANKDRLAGATSWRLQSDKNIVDDKYIFKHQGVVTGANDGILKNGTEQLSTEGVNATLFFNMLNNDHIQAPYSKVLQVFTQTKPQTYRDFLNNYMQMYPEDRSQVINQFLETTKYTTVDPNAAAKYKEVFDAQQAAENAPADQQAQLQADYQQKLQAYNEWKDQLYKQAVVDGKIDKAVGADGEPQTAAAPSSESSGDTQKQYQKIKLSETLIKGQKALSVGLDRAADSIKQSFSVKNLAITAGTSIAVNLASQIMNGQKPSLKSAMQAVESWQFVGNVVGSSLGAAAGQVFAPLIQTFVPIPVVGQIAGALLPTLLSNIGGQVGGNLGAHMSLKDAIKGLDPVAIAGQSVGSMVGAMLGSMIPIPVVGQMIGGIIGGIVGEKVFTGIASLFGYHKKQAASSSQATPTMPTGASTGTPLASYQAAPAVGSSVQASDATGPASQRLPASLDRIPYEKMAPNLRSVKDDYEQAYQRYVQAVTSGDTTAAQSALNAFVSQRERYRRTLGAYLK